MEDEAEVHVMRVSAGFYMVSIKDGHAYYFPAVDELDAYKEYLKHKANGTL